MSVIKVYASGNTLFVGGKTFPINSGITASGSRDDGSDLDGRDFDTDYVIIKSGEDEALVSAPYDEIYKANGSTQWGTDRDTVISNLGALFLDTNPDNYGDADDIADNASEITEVKGRVTTTETDIINIKNAVKIDKGSNDRGVYYDDGKSKTNSLLSVGDGTATIQGGKGTAIIITEASPGSQSFSVAAGPEGSEVSFEAVKLEGKTALNSAALNLQAGTKLGFGDTTYSSTLGTAALTAARNIELPDASGTVALTTDIPLSLWNQTGDDIYYTTGNVGIGTNTPESSLHIKVDNDLSNNYALKVANSSGTDILTVENDGNLTVTNSITSSVLNLNDGQSNIIVSDQTLNLDSTSDNNIIIGLGAAQNMSGSNADRNIIIGNNAAKELSNVNSRYNTIIGYNAFSDHSGSHSSHHTIIGYNAGLGMYDDGYPSSTVVIGANATASHYYKSMAIGTNSTSGYNGHAIGNGASAPGDGTLAVGAGASAQTSGTAIGQQSSANGSSIAIGRGVNSSAAAGINIGSSGNTYRGVLIGYSSVGQGNQGVAIGFNVGNGAYSSTIGHQAGRWNTGNSNVTMGRYAMMGVSGSTNIVNTVAIGEGALQNITTGQGNTAIGHQTLQDNTTGGSNTALGHQALANAVGQVRNTAVGYRAFDEITDHVSYSTGLGHGVSSGGNDRVIVIGHNITAGGSTSVSIGGSGGYQGVAIGYGAKSFRGISIGRNAGNLLQGNTDHNIFIGNDSGYAGDGCRYNTFLGSFSGKQLSGGDNNVLLGYQAGYNIADGSDNIFLGYQAGYNETGSNKLYIENSSSTSPLIYGEFDNRLVRVNGNLQTKLDGQTHPSLQVGEVIKLKPSDNGTVVPGSDNAAVYIDRGGSTSTDVVALNIGDKLRIKRNGGGTPTFDADNAGFIYSQNYDTNDVSNTNPFNNGAGFGARGNFGSIFGLSATSGRPAIFGALNTAGASLLLGNPSGYSKPGGAGPYYNPSETHSTYFFNSSGFTVDFGGKTTDGDFRKSIFKLGLLGVANSRSHTANGSSIGAVPTLEISTDNGDVYVTNGSTTVSCALANETIRGHLLPDMVIYIADNLDKNIISTGASYVKYTVATVDYTNNEFELTTAYSGTTGIANAWIQDKVLKVEGFDGHEIATFYGNDVLRVNGAIEVNNPDSTGFKLPTADGNEAQILSTDGAGNVSWIDGYNLQEQVKNVSGGTLYRGTPVHVTGSTGQQSDVVAANATTDYPAHYILDEDLAANESGKAVLIGAIQDVDLTPFGDSASNYSEADTVYLGASGGFTTTKPSFPNKLQQLGVVLKVNTSGNKISGMITGMGQESPLLGDLNDVTLTNPATGQLISYNAALGWYNVDSLTNLQSVSTNSLSVTGSATINAPLSVSSLTLTGTGTGTFSVGALTSDLEILSSGNVRVLLDNDNNETGQSFTVQDPTNTVRFEVTDTGAVTFNDAYSFPNYDGAANQILATNGSGVLSWVTEGSSSGGGASTLNDLSDVTIGSVSNGNILVYNSASSVWEPATPASNVNADWDSTSGDSQIINKPTLATVATSGSYTDLSNKPTIIDELQDLAGTADDITEGQTNLFLTSTERTKLAGVDAGAEPNVNADWDSTTGDSQILNKPSLSPVATSGSYDDLTAKPNIPEELGQLSGDSDDITEGATNLFLTTAERSKLSGVAAGAEVNVNADWDATTGDAQILNKPKVIVDSKYEIDEFIQARNVKIGSSGGTSDRIVDVMGEVVVGTGDAGAVNLLAFWDGTEAHLYGAVDAGAPIQGASAGDPLYLGSGGTFTSTAPSTSGDIVRVVGHYMGQLQGGEVMVFFNPSNSWVEVD